MKSLAESTLKICFCLIQEFEILNPGIIKKPKTLASFDLENHQEINLLQRMKIRFQFSLNAINRLFPHSNWVLKRVQFVRRIRLSLLMRKIDKVKR